jgi:hypothetical protein
VNQIAEPDRRAQIIAACFVCAYAGLDLPAIAVGEATRSERTEQRFTARSPRWRRLR